MDTRVDRAAALAERALPDPSPQMIHARAGDRAPAFDRERYLDDPAAYLDHADLGRLLEPAQPAADVAMLEIVGGSTYAIPPGGMVPLAVRTDPGFPVTYVAVSGGAFESGTATITVAAGRDGIARARFTAVPGAAQTCPVKASSPVRAGIVDFLVIVNPASAPRP